tara:strand:- start:230 stop:1000 length:771 start_codon:yes stop_codon:yes gene_type:complete
MNLNNKFNLDDISNDQAIFTKKYVYRKMNNLNNGYDIYVLQFLNNRFVWDKTNNYLDIYETNNISTENFNNLCCINSENSRFLTIYKIYENIATDSIIYDGNTNFKWNKLNIPFEHLNINSTSLLSIPSHIDLTKEDDDDYFTNFEPLHGWSDLLERNPPDETYCDKSFNDDKEVCFDKDLVLEIPNTEYRIDPYDNEWYTKEEFLDYYGGLTEWNNQDPKLVLRREQYYHFTERFQHLSAEKFMFLFEEYQKTFR